MEQTSPFSARINNCLEAWAALPLPGELPAELVIISTGEVRGKWGYKHVFTAGDTCYFIFRKADLTDVNAAWECADHELDVLVKKYITQTEQL
jgi:hypothetical protein